MIINESLEPISIKFVSKDLELLENPTNIFETLPR